MSSGKKTCNDKIIVAYSQVFFILYALKSKNFKHKERIF